MKFGDLFKSRRNIQVTVIIIFVLLLAGSVWQYRNFVNGKIAQMQEDNMLEEYEDFSFDDLLDTDISIGINDERIEDSSIKEQPIKEVSSSTDNGVKEAEKNKKDKSVGINEKGITKKTEKTTTNVNKDKKEVDMYAMVIPVFGSVSSNFANDTLVYSKTLEQWTTHNGLDIRAEEGSQVRAAMSGVVKEVSNNQQWGMEILIDHGDGICTKYSNLSTLELVSVGQKVKKGDVISGIGRTALLEISEEPHLHFEVLKNGININPEDYLPKQSLKN